MSAASAFLVWYAVGLIGSALCLEFGVRRDGRDVTLRDIYSGLRWAFLAPIPLFTGILYFITWAVEKIPFPPLDRVIFKAKK
jgi:hypothetical protein